ncbi:hypothetical protein AK812_SmicGene9221 [Symbiodinium microadriaticum]|uniref:Uncharacterized protein n=1 Tax=Symbiodinium microadriaticum TaxID=2951 RepID=A0A1Q9EJ35_SYMMI|nr:hypothetical protein AK812_SmicGene9221 [Symbiodinium microadriaticum]
MVALSSTMAGARWKQPLQLTILEIVIPLYVFEFKERGFKTWEVLLLTVLEWMTQLFWTADLITSSMTPGTTAVSCSWAVFWAVPLMTGFYEKGSLVLDLKRSFFHYMKTWGPFDLSLVTVGWLFIFLGSGDDNQVSCLHWQRRAEVRAESRIEAEHNTFNGRLRFLRFVRVLRWLKLRGGALIMVSMIMAVVLSRVASCMSDSETRLSNNLAATSSEVLVAFRSLMTYATLISSITTLSGALNKIKALLRRVPVVPLMLVMRIPAAPRADALMMHAAGMRIMSISGALGASTSTELSQKITRLSNSLKGELDFARRNDAMLKLSYLDNLLPTEDVQVMQTMQNLASGAMEDVAAASGDFIFLGGSKATAAYLKLLGFISKPMLNGSLNYFYADRNEEEKHQEVTDETWIAEICLWASWAYQGDLVAEDVSRLTVPLGGQ